jgi:ATP-dependent DNA helicase RecG
MADKKKKATARTRQPPADELTFPVSRCRGVGPKISLLLSRLDITTIEDLLHHFPRTYLDRRHVLPVASVEESSSAVVAGEIIEVKGRRLSRRRHIIQSALRDQSGTIRAIWFNQPYLLKTITKGCKVILSGAVYRRSMLQFENPDVEVVEDDKHESLHTLALIPIYPLTEGLGQKKMRRLLAAALDDYLDVVPETFPEPLLQSHGLLAKQVALRTIHFPDSETEMERAKKRLAFEEFAALQLNLLFEKRRCDASGITFSAPPRLTARLDDRLPFRLTKAQEKAIHSIFRQMESPAKMNILLHGDVGSGKTVVAAHAMVKALDNERQAVLMAPTEILAEQHYMNLRHFLKDLEIPVALLTAGRPAYDRKQTAKLMQSGNPCLIVGTHALISEKLSISDLGLAVIDEQHRFGVNQRAALVAKGLNPDLLVMTATPIPRTLALTLYSGFEILLLDEYPPGRKPVETAVVTESGRATVLKLVEKQVEMGRQVFVVCPEIGSDSSFPNAVANVRQALSTYSAWLPKLSVDCIHGKMPLEERERVLQKFSGGEIQVLIATTIIEVGIDVPNATVMIIESAEKFGLSQLHQLRGRIGRSKYKSSCFLFTESVTPQAKERLRILEMTNDGLLISEKDLLLRGPGELLGTAQSGLPRLRVGHLARDVRLLEHVRHVVEDILKVDPSLKSPENEPLNRLLKLKRAGIQL